MDGVDRSMWFLHPLKETSGYIHSNEYVLLTRYLTLISMGPCGGMPSCARRSCWGSCFFGGYDDGYEPIYIERRIYL